MDVSNDINRLDIAFEVEKFSRFTSNMGSIQWIAIRRVLKYLKGIVNHGICYSEEYALLEGYSNASWITNKKDSSSITGWVFIYWGGVISCSSKKQTCISDFTFALKFISLASGSKV